MPVPSSEVSRFYVGRTGYFIEWGSSVLPAIAFICLKVLRTNHDVEKDYCCLSKFEGLGSDLFILFLLRAAAVGTEFSCLWHPLTFRRLTRRSLEHLTSDS
jgi:hypothetical protein